MREKQRIPFPVINQLYLAPFFQHCLHIKLCLVSSLLRLRLYRGGFYSLVCLHRCDKILLMKVIHRAPLILPPPFTLSSHLLPITCFSIFQILVIVFLLSFLVDCFLSSMLYLILLTYNTILKCTCVLITSVLTLACVPLYQFSILWRHSAEYYGLTNRNESPLEVSDIDTIISFKSALTPYLFRRNTLSL